MSKLPDFLEKAIWVYDEKHKNILAFFDIGERYGKAAIHIAFNRKAKKMNAVITTGSIDKRNINQKELHKIK